MSVPDPVEIRVTATSPRPLDVSAQAGVILLRPTDGASTHAGLPDLDTSGHPGDVITLDAPDGTGNLSSAVTDVQTLANEVDALELGDHLHANLTDRATSGHPGNVITLDAPDGTGNLSTSVINVQLLAEAVDQLTLVGTGLFTISETPPSDPQPGQGWWRSTDGATAVWVGTTWVEIGVAGAGGSGGIHLYESATEPVSPALPALWFNTTNGVFSIYYNGAWVGV